MCDHDLRMCLEPRLYSPSLPLPEDHVALSVTAADPLPVWRETDLAGVPGDGVTSKSFISRLAEIVRTVDEDLVVQ